MMWVCPACWSTFGTREDRCPICDADLTALDARPYADKLIRALDHPEPHAAMRAAELLGRRREPGALPVLAAAFRRRSHEPYVAAAIVRALGYLPGHDPYDLLIEALGHPSIIVRAAAAAELQSRDREAS